MTRPELVEGDPVRLRGTQLHVVHGAGGFMFAAPGALGRVVGRDGTRLLVRFRRGVLIPVARRSLDLVLPLKRKDP